jgi:hypothetical protein
MPRPNIRFDLPAICVGAVLTLFQSANATTPKAQDAVWHWYARCRTPTQIDLELIFDHKPIYTASFNVCHLLASSIVPEQHQKVLKFDFISSRRSVFGEPKGAHLEGNIWEAGKNENDLVLGVSLAGPMQVWCNFLHVLDLKKNSETLLAPGFLVRTRPRV